jgi:opacity protein-like surface antigen
MEFTRMKSSLVKTLLLGTALTCASASFAFAEDYNWSGVFIGGTVGATESTSKSSIDYGYVTTEDGDGEYNVGWENGYFTGAIYDDMDGLDMIATSNDGTEDTASHTDNAVVELGAMEDWLNYLKNTDMDWSGTAILGAQMQSGGLIYGAELRGTFGNFDTETSDEWTDTATGSDFETCEVTDNNGSDATCEVDYFPVGGNVTWDRTSDHIWNLNSNSGSADVAAGYEATYTQDNALSFGANYDKMYSPVAKLGFAADRVHMFVMGGPSWAKVTAVTSAQANESGHVDVYTDNSATALDDFTGSDVVGVSEGSRDYDWSGSNTETLTGYSVGGGLEWAATNNLILRVEGLYTDLGSISVTGTSNDTLATYTVTQELTNVSGSAGMLLKF